MCKNLLDLFELIFQCDGIGERSYKGIEFSSESHQSVFKQLQY